MLTAISYIGAFVFWFIAIPEDCLRVIGWDIIKAIILNQSYEDQIVEITDIVGGIYV